MKGHPPARLGRWYDLHIMHDAGAGWPYDAKATIGQIAASVAPLPGEPVVVKNYPNSFEKTDLDAFVEEERRTEPHPGRFMTHMCVNSTTRMPFNLGYRNTVVAATATRTLPRHRGSSWRLFLQNASLAALSDLFAVVVRSGADVP